MNNASRIYALVLNDMRAPNVENVTVVRVSHDREELVRWYTGQLVDETWRDGPWQKVFRSGSELEWFNPAPLTDDNDYWGGIWQVPDGTPVGMALVKS